jgi:hypothetical protein
MRICICTSAYFYRQALEIEKKLKELGFKVSVPLTSKVMERTGNFDVSFYRTWLKDPKYFKRKKWLMLNHFEKIERSDALLVVNFSKNNIDGYIGGNVLMEMGIAFYLKKPIFVLNPISNKSTNYEEVLGMMPKFLGGDLEKLTF